MSLLGSLLARSREPTVSVRPRQRSVFEAWPTDPMAGAPSAAARGEGLRAPGAPTDERPSRASSGNPGATEASAVGPRPSVRARTPSEESEDANAPESYRAAARPTGEHPRRPDPPRPSRSADPTPAGRSESGRPPTNDPTADGTSAPPRPRTARPADTGRPEEPVGPAPRQDPTLPDRSGPPPSDRPDDPSRSRATPTPSGTRPRPSRRPAAARDDRDGSDDAARRGRSGPTDAPHPTASPSRPRSTDHPEPEPTLPTAAERPAAAPSQPRPLEPRRPARRPAPTLQPRKLEAPPGPPAPEAPPPIHVSIGRVEVRAVRPQPTPAPSVKTPPPMVSLDDYLGRGGRPT